MRNVSAVVLSLAAFLCAFASPAGADPIRVTSGHVFGGGSLISEGANAEALYLTGHEFWMGTSLEDEMAFIQLQSVPTIVEGASVNLSGTLFVNDPLGAELNGSFVIMNAPFQMLFHTPATTLGCSSDGPLTICRATAPFTLTAELTLTPLGGAPFTQQFVGRGTAEGLLVRSAFGEGGQLLYTFEPSPVPEPASLSLIATGAIMAGTRVWRRRRAGGRTA